MGRKKPINDLSPFPTRIQTIERSLTVARRIRSTRKILIVTPGLMVRSFHRHWRATKAWSLYIGASITPLSHGSSDNKIWALGRTSVFARKPVHSTDLINRGATESNGARKHLICVKDCQSQALQSSGWKLSIICLRSDRLPNHCNCGTLSKPTSYCVFE